MYTSMMSKGQRIFFFIHGFFPFLQNYVRALSHANPSTYIHNYLNYHQHYVTSILDARIHLPL